MTVAAALDAVRASAPGSGAVVGCTSPSGWTTGASGQRDTAGSPVTTDTAFDLASVTKVVGTTTAVLELVAAREIALDHPVGAYLTEHPCAATTTVRDLLTHRAGLWEWQPLYQSTSDPFRTINRLPLRYRPGAARHYSDIGFLLLGRILEVVTQRRLDTALQTLVFEPAGMTRTGFGPVTGPVASSSLGDAAEQRMVTTGQPYPIIVSDRAVPWRDHELSGEVNDGNAAHACSGIAGHAGLFSTVADMLTLGAALASPDRARSWPAAGTAQLLEPGADAAQSLGWRRGLIRLEDAAPRTILWHPGYTGCAFGFVPGTGVSVAVLTNRLMTPDPPPTTQLWDVATTALFEPVHTPATSREDT